MNAADREAVARVRAYPFHAATAGGEAALAGDERAPEATGLPAAGEPFVLGGGWGEGPALLAYGANAAPAVLAAKLGAAARATAAPATLCGFDIAYSAHVSPYGAIPATLVPSAGTAIAVYVLRLPASALAALDATEPNYVRADLGGGLQAYRSRHGALRLDGREHALAAVTARRRRLPVLTEAQVLERVRALLEPGADFDAFVLAGIRDAGVRAARTRALRATARE